MKIVATRNILTRRQQRGATAVEFAVILPVLIVIVLGGIDFGRFASTYIAVTNAARAGAAFGSMNPYSTATQSSWVAQTTQAAKDEMFNQTGYNASNLTVTASALTSGEVIGGLWRVKVVASYPFKTLVNWPGLPTSDGKPINLTRTVVLRAIR